MLEFLGLFSPQTGIFRQTPTDAEQIYGYIGDADFPLSLAQVSPNLYFPLVNWPRVNVTIKDFDFSSKLTPGQYFENRLLPDGEQHAPDPGTFGLTDILVRSNSRKFQIFLPSSEGPLNAPGVGEYLQQVTPNDDTEFQIYVFIADFNQYRGNYDTQLDERFNAMLGAVIQSINHELAAHALSFCDLMGRFNEQGNNLSTFLETNFVSPRTEHRNLLLDGSAARADYREATEHFSQRIQNQQINVNADAFASFSIQRRTHWFYAGQEAVDFQTIRHHLAHDIGDLQQSHIQFGDFMDAGDAGYPNFPWQEE